MCSSIVMGSHETLVWIKEKFCVRLPESAKEAFYLCLCKETELPLTNYNQYQAD